MKRYQMNVVDRFLVQNASVNTVVPVYRKHVVPNTTITELDIDVSVMIPEMDGFYLNKADAYVQLYYVPHRIVWPDWPWYIAGDNDKSVTLPSTIGTLTEFFQRTDQHALYLRAYKAVYNEYFGDFDLGQIYDVEDDTVVSLGVGRRVDPVLTATKLAADVQDETIDVSSGTLSMQELRLALAEYAGQAKRDLTGDRYHEVLQTFGVSADAGMIGRPQKLQVGRIKAGGQVELKASETRDTSTNIGKPFSQYRGNLQVKFKPRKGFYIPEHGYIVGVAVVRFHDVEQGSAVIDSIFDSPKDFFDGTQIAQEVNIGGLGYLSKTVHLSPGASYVLGQTVKSGDVPVTTSLNHGPYQAMPLPVATGGTLGGDATLIDLNATLRGYTPASTRVRV